MEAPLAIPLLDMKSVFFLSRGYEWEPRADTFPLVFEVRAAR